MKKYLLLPHGFERIGWAMLIVSLVLMVAEMQEWLPNFHGHAFSLIPDTSSWTSTDGLGNVEKVGGMRFWVTNDSWWDEIYNTMLYCSLYFIGMARVRQEDELTLMLRLKSLLWAFMVNTGLLVVATLIIYGWGYIYVLIYQPVVIFVLFIGRFKYELYQLRRASHEE